jgi:hypothetical protein
MKKTTDHLMAEVQRRQSGIELTIGIDLGDVWSHHCTLNEDGQVIDRGPFEPYRRRLISDLQIFLTHAWRWRLEPTRSGLASNYRNLVMK